MEAPDVPATSNLTSLAIKHREVARLKTLGMKNHQIADQVGISVGSVNQILSNPLCQEYMKRIDDEVTQHTIDVRKELIDLQAKSLTVMSQGMDEGVPWPTRLKAAQDILDRTGYAPVRQNFTVNVSHQLTKEDIDAINRRAREAGVLREAELDEPKNVTVVCEGADDAE